ncbi:ephrin type-A receptor 4-like isoform X1 [Limulus polyphemus]|uniref:receptor protein-tyrosine kinase n=1 Tax=Limulus polyphemus TaxID=6850 RepID=A0ABM1SJ38_LIMPO|nr:ephrin type-A receptor 4-like isoform X1 [Limulus polyphemus]
MAPREKERWRTLAVLTLCWWLYQPSASNQVVLLDTTTESTLDWTRYPYGPQARTPGWVEESFTNFEQGINWRSFVVCDVAYSNVNNWLWTPFVERRDASRIYIEIKFSMRDCNLFPGMALSCKETFSLLYYEFDAATKEPPPWEPESYKLVDRIAADEGRFTSTSEVIINTEVRSIPVTKKGVYFAFRDQGACLSIIAIKVYYMTCPNITLNLAFFPDSPTGREVTEIVEVEGQCVINSEVVDPPKLLCKGDGNWTLPSGGCKCKAGYEFRDQSCQVCTIGTYKSSVGNSLCTSCPLHSSALYKGSIECACDERYYRASTDLKDAPCSQPPSVPQNLSVSFVDQSTVILAWQPPRSSGGRNDTTYRLTCDVCGHAVSYVPSQMGFSETKVTISGLNPVTTYRFQVYAENGVSSYSESQFVERTVTTAASVYHVSIKSSSSVNNFRVLSVKSAVVVLAWDPPEDPYIQTEIYEVRYFLRGQQSNSSSVLTKKPESSLTGLTYKTEYGFQVRAKTTHGWGEYSKPIYTTTGQLVDSTAYVEEEEDQVQVRIIAGATVAVVVLVVVIVVMIVLYIRRSSDDYNKKQPSDCDTLDYGTGEGKKLVPGLEHPPIVPTAGMTTLLFTHCGGPRSYIDPHTYEDPNQAVREFAKEIDASHITIEAIIGGGEFGDVCKGKLKVPSQPEITVAIKTLKPGSPDKARMDFLTEASIMGQFDHPNVIYLQGVVTKSYPVMIITEYMGNGSLDTFLRANDGKFQVIQLVGMLRGIAAGMQYLSEMNYIHRDLAARNVLVNNSLVCKIADFGLSREIESAAEGAYTTRGGKIPVRWTAPEAIAFRKFTSASDVWSFGIVCWEVMSYGERPYWNWSNQDVIKSIEKGYRLPAPMDCSEALHQLMLDCWQNERSYRPSFSSIVTTLDKLSRCPDSLRKIANNKNQNPLDPHTSDMMLFKSIPEWLDSLKMTRYLENFDHAGITTMEAVARLTHKDLTTLGVTLAGHQKKLLNSVQMLRAQMSEGFLV